ncbi:MULTISPECIES: response regulator [unclassified Phyllobacterium]|uniref:response regulator n=1 Tax=unclassified Phyllobacterium TaxID=2638441 RepID=UPI003012A40E
MLVTRNMPSVLIVDNDPTLGKTIVEYLARNDMSAELTATRVEALSIYQKLDPDMIILDLKLHRDDGLDVLRDLRSSGDVPVIMTGHQLEESDRVVGLELGADDYLTKPFGMRELLARIRAVMRRRAGSDQRQADRGKWRFGGWELRLKTRQLLDPEGLLVPLTKGEYALLLAFIEAAGRPLSREYLLQATRIHEDIFDRSIDVKILRLRRKLEADASLPKVIKTERGIGYTFAIPATRAC